MSSTSESTGLLHEPLLVQPAASKETDEESDTESQQRSLILTSPSNGGAFNGATPTASSSVGKSIELSQPSAEKPLAARAVASRSIDSEDRGGGRRNSRVHWLDDSTTAINAVARDVSGSFRSTLGRRGGGEFHF